MLNNKNIIIVTALKFVTLLLFISIITFHTDSLAGSKEKLFQEYREAGYQQQQKGNFNEALTYFSKAVSLGYDDPKLYNDMGVIYEQVGFLGRAEEFYGLAIKKDKSYLPAYTNMALMYKNNGHPDKAFPYFKKRFELSKVEDPWGEKAKEEMLKIKPEYYVWIVQLEAEKLDKQIVEKHRNEFIDRVKRSTEHYKKGEKHAENQEFKKALNEYNMALHLTPKNPKVINARREAMKQLTSRQIREHTDIAIKQINAGDSYSAKRELQKILSNFPDESLLHAE